MPISGKIVARVVVISLLFLCALVVIPYLNGYKADLGAFERWASFTAKYGLTNAYGSHTDYLPIYQYFLWAYGKLVGVAHIISGIGYLRLATLAIEMLSLWYVYKWIDRRVDFALLLIINLFNIAFSYNTMVWGQVDGILAAFVFISFYYGWQKKTVLAFAWFIIALNFKLQAIIFLPVFGLLLLQNQLNRAFILKLTLGILVALCLEGIILYPFIHTAYNRRLISEAAFGAVGRYPFVSNAAYNFWYLLYWDQPLPQNDQGIVLWGLSHRNLGLVLFFTMSFFSLWPLIRSTLKRILKKPDEIAFSKARFWLISASIPLIFFFCNTQMHDRYSHPAFIFLTAYTFYSKDFIPYVLFSIAYFLNLEGVLKWLDLNNYDTLIFAPRFIAGIYCLLILYVLYRIYFPVVKRGDVKQTQYDLKPA